MKFLLGKKREMKQVYDEKGSVKPVTEITLGSCVVTQIRTKEKDGYTAVQIGFGEKRKVSKALRGHFKGSFTGKDGRGFQYVKEQRLETVNGIEKGAILDTSSFVVGDRVTVISQSKGKGFAGVVKRHHFHGHPSTHGHKDQERMPGSIGAGGNQHVFKGVRMAGRMGNDRVTVKNLEIIGLDTDNGVLLVKGAVPGARNGLVIIQADGEMKFKTEAHESEQKSEKELPSSQEAIPESEPETAQESVESKTA